MLKGVFTFIVALTFTTQAMAADLNDPIAGLNGDGTVEVDDLPESGFPTGKPCINQEDGQRYQCFTLEEMKELKKWEAELAFFETGYYQLSEKVPLLEQKISILEDEKERIYLKWENENKLRLEAENKPKIGSALAWTLVGVLTLGLVGLGVAYGAK